MKNIDYDKIRGKKVLLYSGGMDCYIINRLENPDVLLFIDNKSNYSSMEKELLLKRKETDESLKNLVIVEDFINMSLIERDDYIIPSRNAYFILKAAEYGDEIILGATAGDRSTDKDIRFADMMTDLLNHIYEDSHWCKGGRHIKVNFKYKECTKKDLIEMFMKKYNLSGEETARILMENSSSCYDFKDGKPCGTCKPCTRKWLAILGATGVDTGQYFDTHPRSYFTSETIEQWIDRESGPNNRGRESEEIIATLKSL